MAIHRILQPLRSTDRDPVISVLLAWAYMDPVGRPDYRPLTTGELIQLAESELVDVGFHTTTHTWLAAMSRTDQYAEIAGSRQKLEGILGSRVDTFSYPYGTLTPETVDIVETAGFKVGLTTDEKAVEVGADQFQLGRFGVGDWDGEKFRQYLDEFFRA